jgi:hypothetical protein
MYQERTTKEYLKRLINTLTEGFVIVTRFFRSGNYHTPSILKEGDKYQVYTCMYSQFDEYESIDDLIDYFFKFVNLEDEYYFEIVLESDFEKMRKSSISSDIATKSVFKRLDSNFTIITKELEKYGGTYVITPSNTIEFLISACSTDEDYYYVCLIVKGINIELSFHTCVGYFIPLIDRLNEEEYKNIQSYVLNEHIETLDPKTLRPGHKIITENIEKFFNESTTDVLFTPIYLIRDGKR